MKHVAVTSSVCCVDQCGTVSTLSCSVEDGNLSVSHLGGDVPIDKLHLKVWQQIDKLKLHACAPLNSPPPQTMHTTCVLKLSYCK